MFNPRKRMTLGTSQDALANYNAGFYNSFIAALNLDPKSFQLTQGAVAEPSLKTDLYNIFDGVPPISVCNLWTANALNKVSGNIEDLLGYANQAEMNSFPYKVASAGFLNTANWVGGTVGANPVYSPTLTSIGQALHKGSSASFHYDSQSASTSLNGSWAQSASSGGVWFWGYNEDAVSQSINTDATSSDVTVDVEMTYATVPIQQGGWFNSGYLIQMYQNQSDWNTASDWNTLFGPNGSFQYFSTEALIVTDFKITVTSKASYSASQYNYVAQSKNVNVWPFYTSSKSSATKTDYTQNSDSSITATIQSLPGAVQIMGFSVISTKDAVTSLT